MNRRIFFFLTWHFIILFSVGAADTTFFSYQFVCVDFQKDFCISTGRWYQPRASHEFITNVIVPYLKAHKLTLAEIVSDYRLPRPSEKEAYCVPGEEGFLSEIPMNVKDSRVWIKAMNSPDWVRDSIGEPYQDGAAFTSWLKNVVGDPEKTIVILIGLTLDCCVLCTAQQLYFRGYEVKILIEGVDTYSGAIVERDQTINSSTFRMWATPISWKEVKALML